MKGYINQVISIIIAFVVTLLVSFGIDQLFGENGSISLSKRIELSTGSYVELAIENYSKSTINGLKIIIPNDAPTNLIRSSQPIELKVDKAALSSPEHTIITLSFIPSKKITRVFFPLFDETSECCEVINSNELKLLTKTDSEVFNPVISSLYGALRTASIYTVFVIIIAAWLKSKLNLLQERLNKLESEHVPFMEKATKQSNEFHKRIDEMRQIAVRQRVILLRQLSDYRTELSFWRDSIRKILYEKYKNNENADVIIKDITNNLKTYGTRSKLSGDYEVIKAMADTLRDADNMSTEADNND